MNGKTPATYWWLVCSVVLLYHDLSVYALHRKHIRNSAGAYQKTTNPIVKGAAQNVHLSKQRHGVCNTLVLTGASTIPGISKNEAIGVFLHRNSEFGLNAWYQDIHDPRVHLFYDEMFEKWVIGMRSEGKTSIAIELECRTAEPQESRCGAHTSQNRHRSVRWIFDPTLHLDCVEDNASSGRTKRGIWSVLASVFVFVIVPIAMTNIIKSEQKRQGCLFYRSLCEKRDRIEHSLKPQIQNLQNDLKNFGHPLDQLPSVINETKTHMKYIREMVSRIESVFHKIKIKLEMARMNTSSINLEIFGQLKFLRKNALEDYQQWLFGILTDQGMKNSLLPANIYQAFTPTSSGFLGLVGLIPTVVGVIQMANEERKANHQLSEDVKKLVDIRNRLVKAKSSILEFKKMYNATVIPSLKLLVRYVKNDFPRFWNLLRALSFEKINMWSLSLVNRYLRNMSDVIHGEEKRMETLVKKITRYDNFFSSVTSMLKRGCKFDTIYERAKLIREELGLPKFETKFRFLHFIADEVTKSNCYWGMDLDLVRRGKIHRNDWSKIPVCLSSEINVSLKLLKSGVKTNVAPCRQVRQLDNRIFGSILKVVRFLADYVIPNESCYWGYDLENIRRINELDSAKFPVIDSKVVYFLRLAMVNKQTDVFETLCLEKNVCIQSPSFRENLIQFANTGNCGKNKNRENQIPANNIDFGHNFCSEETGIY